MILRLLLLLSIGISVQAQTAAPEEAALHGGGALLEKLPPAIRELGADLLQEPDEKKRATLVARLLRQHTGSAAFVIDYLAGEESPVVRAAALERMGRIETPEVKSALLKYAQSDPDPQVILMAFEKLRLHEMRELSRLYEDRLRRARQEGNGEILRTLAKGHDRWIAYTRGAMLPGFMQEPPPLFTLKPVSEPVRVLAFGDFGQGTAFQKNAAAGMLTFHHKQPFDFAITVGDNFYSKGMESPSDPRWKTWWDELYDPLGIPFYATLGNHDWGLPDSPAAEVLYTQKSPSWRMPATRYTFTAGPVQFFALDTDAISEQQLLWLEEELSKSRARWKVVYGHHPIYSHGEHGDTENLIADLLPILKKAEVDIYLAGHEHDLQHLKPEGGVHFFIAGGGGARVRPVEAGPRSLFALSSYGFAVLEADEDSLQVRFVDPAQKELYSYTLQ